MPPPSASPYDLTLAGADCPRWDGPPRRSILICSHPRSGSTLLGEAIRFAGGLGCPLEYLHRASLQGTAGALTEIKFAESVSGADDVAKN